MEERVCTEHRREPPFHISRSSAACSSSGTSSHQHGSGRNEPSAKRSRRAAVTQTHSLTRLLHRMATSSKTPALPVSPRTSNCAGPRGVTQRPFVQQCRGLAGLLPGDTARAIHASCFLGVHLLVDTKHASNTSIDLKCCEDNRKGCLYMNYMLQREMGKNKSSL